MVKRTTDQRDFRHTWYLREWMNSFHPPKTQADMQREMDWSKAKANDVFAGQQYTQRILEDVSSWLQVRPYELLLPPEEAMAIRRMREAAVRIATEAPATAPERKAS